MLQILLLRLEPLHILAIFKGTIDKYCSCYIFAKNYYSHYVCWFTEPCCCNFNVACSAKYYFLFRDLRENFTAFSDVIIL